MPEFRQNMVTKQWVIIAPERGKRPKEFTKKKETKSLPAFDKDCPFCLGNENKTPKPVYTIKKNGRWRIRVVPNKFAALRQGLNPTRKREGRAKKYLRAEGFGIAEVVIETPAHHKTIATMSYSEVSDIIASYKARYKELAEHKNISMITVFRNHGMMAGTSLIHPHSQIIATPIVPPHTRDQIFQARVAFDTHGRCIYCDMLKEELSEKKRVITETEHFVVFSPYASRFPFETNIIPKKHNSSFDAISKREADDFAKVLRDTMKRIHLVLDNPDYNYIIRSCPTDERNAKYYHWYAAVIPRLSTPAGFELGTGIYINITSPEDAARLLRKVKI